MPVFQPTSIMAGEVRELGILGTFRVLFESSAGLVLVELFAAPGTYECFSLTYIIICLTCLVVGTMAGFFVAKITGCHRIRVSVHVV